MSNAEGSPYWQRTLNSCRERPIVNIGPARIRNDLFMSASPLSTCDKVEKQIEAIERWNPHVNAMMARNDEAARRDAEILDAASENGDWRGLLHGVTIMVKDNIDTAGIETTNGSTFFKGHVPIQDATIVRKLRDAGAVILGKATLHEFAFGVRSFNPVIGQARNPYDTSRIPGGSSGGSGIAVATGMADMALGTDTGGSVRIPASINGISGYSANGWANTQSWKFPGQCNTRYHQSNGANRE